MSGRTLRWMLVLASALGVGRARAQSGVVWEQMPLFVDRVNQVTHALDWLVGDGTADPSLDTLVMFHSYGVFRYAPGEPGNGEWDPWRMLNGYSPYDGLVTSEGSIVFVPAARRSTDAGQTWDQEGYGAYSIIETTLPWLHDLSGGRAVLVMSVGGAGEHARSLADGEPGSWMLGGPASDFPESIGEVPASPALPLGRLLHNGTYVMYSDDGAMTWQLSALGNQPTEGYLAFRFAFYPIAGHPYGGAVFATGCEYIDCDGGGESVDLYRSDDGGASWALVHEFTAAEVGLPFINGIAIRAGVPHVGPDGALWAGVSRSQGGRNPGRIMRSTDEGLTWHRADAGLAESNGGLGWRVYKLRTARDGRMYAATDRGVWRTTQPVVAAAPSPEPPPGLALAVAPNPTSGRVALTVTPEAPVSSLIVLVIDTRGRIVADVYRGTAGAGAQRYEVDTREWAAGVYVVQALADGQAETARLTVTR